jgi:S-adenosylmethionine:tRNA ribosyltransferase-isomerase
VRLEDLDYDLPLERIAQEPAAKREDARLLVLARGSGAVEHRGIRDLPGLLRAGDLLVVNDTRVRPARLAARRATGGAVEVLLVGPAPAEGPEAWTALLAANRPLRAGETLTITHAAQDVAGGVRLLRRSAEGPWAVAPEGGTFPDLMARYGEMPLPPYIRRDAQDVRAALDRERYQTVFAREEGAVAAPTAGLHFTPALLEAVRAHGVGIASVTLHVGLGTFLPVTAARLVDHRMHAEPYVISAETAAAVRRTNAAGGRVVAVGTTSMRPRDASALAAPDGLPRAETATTDLFVTPGFRFRVVDALLTNFHLPRSTLLALVAAFAGLEPVLAAYREAVAKGYRFTSYGDAMLIA